MMKKLLCMAVILLNAVAALAQSQKFDIMTFTPPVGWRVESNPNAKILLNIDSAKNKLGIIMLNKSVDSLGDVNSDFQAAWKPVQSSFGASAKPDIQKSEYDGFAVMSGSERIKYDGHLVPAVLKVISGKGKAISMLTIANEKSFFQASDQMLSTLKIEIQGAAPQVQTAERIATPVLAANNASSPLAGSAIAGVWVSYAYDFASSAMSWFTRAYFNDGKFLTSIPEKGLSDLSLAQTNLGSYAFSNGSGQEKLPAWSSAQPIQLEKSNQIKVDNKLFFKSDDLSGKTFNASFTSYADPTDAALKSLPKGNRPIIHFYSNGTFEDEGVFKAVLKDYTKPDSFGFPGKGKYRIKDYSIYFEYEDRRERQMALYTWASAGRFPEGKLFLGNFQMNRF